MDGDALRRFTEAVEQARARAAEAAADIANDPEASRAVETAVREAEEALAGLAERLRSDA